MSSSKNIAVVLCGCGREHGTEVTEAVSILIAISEAKVPYTLFSPADVLGESNRIGRGQVRPLETLKVDDFDALALPGGMGAVQRLSNFASLGAKGQVIPVLNQILLDFHQQQKPILAACIAPALVALALGAKHVTLTVGPVGPEAEELKKTGAHVEACDVQDFITDREHKVITTPAYMFGEAKPFDVYTGIRKAVRELIEMA